MQTAVFEVRERRRTLERTTLSHVACASSARVWNAVVNRGLIPEGSLANSNSHGDGNAFRPCIESGTDSTTRPLSAAATAVRNARRSASRCRCRRWSGSSSTLGKNGSSGAGVGNAPSVMPTMNTRSKARPVTDCTGPIRIPRPRLPTGRARPSSASRNVFTNSSTEVPPSSSSTSAWRSSASARATSSAKGASSASQAGVPPHSAVNRRSAHVTNWSHEEPSLGGSSARRNAPISVRIASAMSASWRNALAAGALSSASRCAASSRWRAV